MQNSLVARWSGWIIAAFLCVRISTAVAASFNVLYDFGSSQGDGVTPHGSLIDVGGTLYGMTYSGGADNDGAIIGFNTATGTESVDYSFIGQPTDGASPLGALLQSALDPSTLYGMTQVGGSGGGAGTVFSFNPNSGQEAVLYSFGVTPGVIDGAPTGSLIQSGSTLYGISGDVIFSYNVANGVETPLYSFGGRPDGHFPEGSLIQVGSELYGTCSSGGAYGGVRNPSGQVGGGTMFSYNLNTGQETVLHSFAGGPGDGVAPEDSLVQSGSTLYGTTGGGGADEGGTIFSYNIGTGNYQTIFSFDGPDGVSPQASLVVDGTTLYGMAGDGGGEGCVFAYNTLTDTDTILHTFDGTDGEPMLDDNLTLVGSTLYGMTEFGGTNNDGVIFSIAIPEPATFSILAVTGACLLLRRQRRLSV
jgi:uncharacterized repeat protein (TIGR03803 family)